MKKKFETRKELQIQTTWVFDEHDKPFSSWRPALPDGVKRWEVQYAQPGPTNITQAKVQLLQKDVAKAKLEFHVLSEREVTVIV